MIFGKKKRPVISTDQTGLPELPAGYWWRVSKTPVTSSFSSSPYTIEIRTAKARVVTRGFAALTDEGIANAARVVHISFRDKLEREENEKRLLGDYPPNKLGGAK